MCTLANCFSSQIQPFSQLLTPWCPRPPPLLAIRWNAASHVADGIIYFLRHEKNCSSIIIDLHPPKKKKMKNSLHNNINSHCQFEFWAINAMLILYCYKLRFLALVIATIFGWSNNMQVVYFVTSISPHNGGALFYLNSLFWAGC